MAASHRWQPARSASPCAKAIRPPRLPLKDRRSVAPSASSPKRAATKERPGRGCRRNAAHAGSNCSGLRRRVPAIQRHAQCLFHLVCLISGGHRIQQKALHLVRQGRPAQGSAIRPLHGRQRDAGTLARAAGDQPFAASSAYARCTVPTVHCQRAAIARTGGRGSPHQAAVDDLLPDRFGYLEVGGVRSKSLIASLLYITPGVSPSVRLVRVTDLRSAMRELGKRTSGLLYRLVYSPQSNILIGIQCGWLSSRGAATWTRALTPFTQPIALPWQPRVCRPTQSNPVCLRFRTTKTLNASFRSMGDVPAARLSRHIG